MSLFHMMTCDGVCSGEATNASSTPPRTESKVWARPACHHRHQGPMCAHPSALCDFLSLIHIADSEEVQTLSCSQHPGRAISPRVEVILWDAGRWKEHTQSLGVPAWLFVSGPSECFLYMLRFLLADSWFFIPDSTQSDGNSVSVTERRLELLRKSVEPAFCPWVCREPASCARRLGE